LPVLRIPFAVDAALFAPRSGRPDEPGSAADRAATLCHVADMNPVKDQVSLITALAMLAQEREATLHWVGDGPELGRLRRLARELGVYDRIRWWGRVPHAVVPHVMGLSVAFALSSRHEAQGVALAEAACCGLAIACTSVGIAPELHRPATHLAPPRDPAALAAAMGAALDTGTKERADLRRATAQRFGIDAVDRRVDQVYARVAARGGRAPLAA
jgi:glycosyltransferase involved in cell wall biosynthesis